MLPLSPSENERNKWTQEDCLSGNRTPGARSRPSVGHRQPRPPDLGAPQNPKFMKHVPTDNPPKSSIFTKFEKDAPPVSRSEPLFGHPHTA